MKAASTLLLSGKPYPVQIGYSVIGKIEEKYRQPIGTLLESQRLTPMMDLVVEALKNGARRQGEKMLADQDYTDLLDDNPDWVQQFPALMEQLKPPATEGQQEENPR